MTFDENQKPEFPQGEATASFSEDFEKQLAMQLGKINQDDLDAIAALPEGSALLIVRSGSGVGSRFLLDTDISWAGRHPDADIFLDDVTVSRKHTEFKRTETGFTVKDLGSLNGTYYNGTRIDDEVPLRDGVEVQVGKFRLTFYASPVSAGA